MRRRQHTNATARREAVAYLQAGGRPEAVPVAIRAQAWRASGRDVYRNVGEGWLAVACIGDGTVAVEQVAGIPTMARIDRPHRTPYPLHPVKRHAGKVEGVPPHSLPCGGRESVFVTTDGAVHRGLYWTGNYAAMAEATGDKLARRIADRQKARA